MLVKSLWNVVENRLPEMKQHLDALLAASAL